MSTSLVNLQPPKERPNITRDADWNYWVEGFNEPFSSVTNIIKATVPKELAWWGMQVGVAGTLQLLRDKRINPYEPDENTIAALGKYKLTTNDIMKAGGTRGTEVHDILETYGKTGTLPTTVSDSAAGYAKALGNWLLDNQPAFYVQETMTASLEHRYGGTFDGKCVFQAGKHRGQYTLVDLKTSKRVYKDQHHPQLEAYEHAEVELGQRPTDLRMIVLLKPDGKYQMSVSMDTIDDFLVLLEHYRSIERRKDKSPRRRKA